MCTHVDSLCLRTAGHVEGLREVAEMTSSTFVVGPWSWNADDGSLSCSYSVSDWDFTERFDFGVRKGIDERIARAFDLLAVTAGVSYFKTKAPANISLESVTPDANWSRYVEDLYDKGLREFRFENDLPLEFAPKVHIGTRPAEPLHPAPDPHGVIVPMGGGRDSVLVAFALRSMKPTLMSVGQNPIVEEQAQQLGLELHCVGRLLDPRLLERNAAGALNGHVPVTAINSCVAVALALLLGKSDVVLANERSANVPTRVIDGFPVNHQYSKSGEFEKLLRNIQLELGLPIRYFSALRAYGETEISRLIAKHWRDLPPFVSCNRARIGERKNARPSWCCECAKCYFVYLALAPFIARSELSAYFGRDLLGTSADIEAVERLLLGPERSFECIGTDGETRLALSEAAAGDWRDVPAIHEVANRYPVDASLNTAFDRSDEESPVPEAFRRLIGAL